MLMDITGVKSNHIMEGDIIYLMRSDEFIKVADIEFREAEDGDWVVINEYMGLQLNWKYNTKVKGMIKVFRERTLPEF